MHPTPFWHTDIDLACPTTWPYDRLSYLTAALTADKRLITSTAWIAKIIKASRSRADFIVEL